MIGYNADKKLINYLQFAILLFKFCIYLFFSLSTYVFRILSNLYDISFSFWFTRKKMYLKKYRVSFKLYHFH